MSVGNEDSKRAIKATPSFSRDFQCSIVEDRSCEQTGLSWLASGDNSLGATTESSQARGLAPLSEGGGRSRDGPDRQNGDWTPP